MSYFRLPFVIFAVSSLLFCTSSNAQWISDSSGGDFDGDALYFAATANGLYGFGVRCRSASSEMVFTIPDPSMADASLLKTVNMVGPVVRYKIDGGSIVEVPVSLDVSDNGVIAVGAISNEDLKSMLAMKKTISVVLTIMDKNFHEKKFQAKGSTAAITKVVNGCKLFSE